PLRLRPLPLEFLAVLLRERVDQGFREGAPRSRKSNLTPFLLFLLHLWQGRYKSFPVQQDDHLLTLLRYLERNPVRAGLVERAEAWPWSSAGLRAGRGEAPAFFDPGPVALPRRWLAWVNQPLTEGELARVRHSVARGAPLGEPDWAAQAAERLGLQ